MTRTTIIASIALFVVACCMAISHVLVRIDTARADAKHASELAAGVRTELVSTLQARHVYDLELQRIDRDLALCRRRTESLRGVLEIIVAEQPFNGRVKLPDPPPGWAPWPKVGEYWEPGGDRDGH